MTQYVDAGLDTDKPGIWVQGPVGYLTIWRKRQVDNLKPLLSRYTPTLLVEQKRAPPRKDQA